MTVDFALRVISGALWIALLPLLIMPIWRLLRGRGRNLDPLWAVLALGVANRLTFVGGADRTISYAMAVALAAILLPITWVYQRADK